MRDEQNGGFFFLQIFPWQVLLGVAHIRHVLGAGRRIFVHDRNSPVHTISRWDKRNRVDRGVPIQKYEIYGDILREDAQGARRRFLQEDIRSESKRGENAAQSSWAPTRPSEKDFFVGIFM